jgi:thioesterase domain-containing protein/acyl carrier protein
VVNLQALRNPGCLDNLSEEPSLAWPAEAEGADLSSSTEAERPATREDAERLLLGVWSETLGTQVGPHDAFFDSGGDSLRAVTLLARVDQIFGRRLPMSSLLAKTPTVSAMAQALLAPAHNEATHLVPICPSGTKLPVYWLPGGGGLSVLAFREVSRRLGPDQPVYGFEVRLQVEGSPSSVAEMAALYIKDLRAFQPHGPYFLMGFSFGSLVAFEMAVQLRALGEQVPFVCVFDCVLPLELGSIDRARALSQRLGYHARRFGRLPLRAGVEELSASAKYGFAKLRARLAQGKAAEPVVPPPAATEGIFEALDRKNRAIFEHHRRQPLPIFDGRVTVILATRTSKAGLTPDLDERLTIRQYALAGIEVHRVSGSHLSMIDPPDVEELAPVLRACIARAQASATQFPQPHQPRFRPEAPTSGQTAR